MITVQQSMWWHAVAFSPNAVDGDDFDPTTDQPGLTTLRLEGASSADPDPRYFTSASPRILAGKYCDLLRSFTLQTQDTDGNSSPDRVVDSPSSGVRLGDPSLIGARVVFTPNAAEAKELFGEPRVVSTISDYATVRVKLSYQLMAVYHDGLSRLCTDRKIPNEWFTYNTIPATLVDPVSREELEDEMKPRVQKTADGLDAGFFVRFNRQPDVTQIGCCGVIVEPGSSTTSQPPGECVTGPTLRAFAPTAERTRIWAVRSGFRGNYYPKLVDAGTGAASWESYGIVPQELVYAEFDDDTKLNANIDTASVTWHHAGFIVLEDNPSLVFTSYIGPASTSSEVMGNTWDYSRNLPVDIVDIAWDDRGWLWALCTGPSKTEGTAADSPETTVDGLYRVLPGGWSYARADAISWGGKLFTTPPDVETFGEQVTARLIQSKMGNIQKVACGDGYTLYLFGDGSVECVTADSQPLNTPPVEVLSASVVKIAASATHAACIFSGASGRIKVWPMNGSLANSSYIIGPNADTGAFTDVDCNIGTMTVAIENGGTVKAWGAAPQVPQSPDGSPFTKARCGSFHIAALDTSGNLVVTGNYPSETNAAETIPDVIDFDCGEDYLVFITTSGQIQVRGDNTRVSNPPNPLADGRTPIRVAAGGDHAVVLAQASSTAVGKFAYAWGNTGATNTGVPLTYSTSTGPLSFDGQQDKFVDVSCGWRHTCLITDGSFLEPRYAPARLIYRSKIAIDTAVTVSDQPALVMTKSSLTGTNLPVRSKFDASTIILAAAGDGTSPVSFGEIANLEIYDETNKTIRVISATWRPWRLRVNNETEQLPCNDSAQFSKFSFSHQVLPPTADLQEFRATTDPALLADLIGKTVLEAPEIPPTQVGLERESMTEAGVANQRITAANALSLRYTAAYAVNQSVNIVNFTPSVYTNLVPYAASPLAEAYAHIIGSDAVIPVQAQIFFQYPYIGQTVLGTISRPAILLSNPSFENAVAPVNYTDACPGRQYLRSPSATASDEIIFCRNNWPLVSLVPNAKGGGGTLVGKTLPFKTQDADILARASSLLQGDTTGTLVFSGLSQESFQSSSTGIYQRRHGRCFSRLFGYGLTGVDLYVACNLYNSSVMDQLSPYRIFYTNAGGNTTFLEIPKTSSGAGNFIFGSSYQPRDTPSKTYTNRYLTFGGGFYGPVLFDYTYQYVEGIGIIRDVEGLAVGSYQRIVWAFSVTATTNTGGLGYNSIFLHLCSTLVEAGDTSQTQLVKGGVSLVLLSGSQSHSPGARHMCPPAIGTWGVLFSLSVYINNSLASRYGVSKKLLVEGPDPELAQVLSPPSILTVSSGSPHQPNVFLPSAYPSGIIRVPFICVGWTDGTIQVIQLNGGVLSGDTAAEVFSPPRQTLDLAGTSPQACWAFAQNLGRKYIYTESRKIYYSQLNGNTFSSTDFFDMSTILQPYSVIQGASYFADENILALTVPATSPNAEILYFKINYSLDGLISDVSLLTTDFIPVPYDGVFHKTWSGYRTTDSYRLTNSFLSASVRIEAESPPSGITPIDDEVKGAWFTRDIVSHSRSSTFENTSNLVFNPFAYLDGDNVDSTTYRLPDGGDADSVAAATDFDKNYGWAYIPSGATSSGNPGFVELKTGGVIFYELDILDPVLIKGMASQPVSFLLEQPIDRNYVSGRIQAVHKFPPKYIQFVRGSGANSFVTIGKDIYKFVPGPAGGLPSLNISSIANADLNLQTIGVTGTAFVRTKFSVRSASVANITGAIVTVAPSELQAGNPKYVNRFTRHFIPQNFTPDISYADSFSVSSSSTDRDAFLFYGSWLIKLGVSGTSPIIASVKNLNDVDAGFKEWYLHAFTGAQPNEYVSDYLDGYVTSASGGNVLAICNARCSADTNPGRMEIRTFTYSGGENWNRGASIVLNDASIMGTDNVGIKYHPDSYLPQRIVMAVSDDAKLIAVAGHRWSVTAASNGLPVNTQVALFRKSTNGYAFAGKIEPTPADGIVSGFASDLQFTKQGAQYRLSIFCALDNLGTTGFQANVGSNKLINYLLTADGVPAQVRECNDLVAPAQAGFSNTALANLNHWVASPSPAFNGSQTATWAGSKLAVTTLNRLLLLQSDRSTWKISDHFTRSFGEKEGDVLRSNFQAYKTGFVCGANNTCTTNIGALALPTPGGAQANMDGRVRASFFIPATTTTVQDTGFYQIDNSAGSESGWTQILSGDTQMGALIKPHTKFAQTLNSTPRLEPFAGKFDPARIARVRKIDLDTSPTTFSSLTGGFGCVVRRPLFTNVGAGGDAIRWPYTDALDVTPYYMQRFTNGTNQYAITGLSNLDLIDAGAVALTRNAENVLILKDGMDRSTITGPVIASIDPSNWLDQTRNVSHVGQLVSLRISAGTVTQSSFTTESILPGGPRASPSSQIFGINPAFAVTVGGASACGAGAKDIARPSRSPFAPLESRSGTTGPSPWLMVLERHGLFDQFFQVSGFDFGANNTVVASTGMSVAELFSVPPQAPFDPITGPLKLWCDGRSYPFDATGKTTIGEALLDMLRGAFDPLLGSIFNGDFIALSTTDGLTQTPSPSGYAWSYPQANSTGNFSTERCLCISQPMNAYEWLRKICRLPATVTNSDTAIRALHGSGDAFSSTAPFYTRFDEGTNPLKSIIFVLTCKIADGGSSIASTPAASSTEGTRLTWANSVVSALNSASILRLDGSIHFIDMVRRPISDPYRRACELLAEVTGGSYTSLGRS